MRLSHLLTGKNTIRFKDLRNFGALIKTGAGRARSKTGYGLALILGGAIFLLSH